MTDLATSDSLLIESQDLDRRRPDVSIPGIGFKGHAAYSKDGQWALIWRSYATKGAAAKGTPHDGSYTVLKRLKNGFQMMSFGLCRWPHYGAINNSGKAVIVFWDGKADSTPSVRTLYPDGREVLRDLSFTTPVDNVSITDDGRYLGILFRTKARCQRTNGFGLWCLRSKVLRYHFFPLVAEGHRIQIDSTNHQVAFHHYLDQYSDRAIVYDFSGQLQSDSRFPLDEPDLGESIVGWYPDSLSDDERRYVLHKIEKYKGGAGWVKSSREAKKRLEFIEDSLRSALGLLRLSVVEASSRIDIDPKLGLYLDRLAALGIHGCDRTSVATTLLRQGVERLAVAGLINLGDQGKL